MKARKLLVATAGTTILGLSTLTNLSPAAAASYTVTWSSSSNYYAYGYAYTNADCTTRNGGTRKLLQVGGVTRATKVRSIKTPGRSSLTNYATNPFHYHTVPVDRCYKIPEPGDWYAPDDPA